MRARTARLLVLAATAMLGLSGTATGDEGTRITVTQIDATAFPQVRLVASVTDAQGKPVRGLVAGDLLLREGGVPQTATVDLASEASPIAIALVLDTSGSMAGRPIADAKAAMASLIQAIGPADQAAVITFDASVRIERPLTADKTALVAATNASSAAGNTAIYDALAAAASELAKAPAAARRAIVLLTDGVDNSSRANPTNVLQDLRTAQLSTYVIGLGNDLDRQALTRIAAAGIGGQFFEAPSSAQLAGIYDSLSAQLLTQYTVTYRSPAAVPDGAAVTAQLVLRRAGTELATTNAVIVVPVGHGTAVSPTVAPPIIEPAPVVIVATPAAGVPRQTSTLIGLLGAAAVLTLLLWISELAGRFPSRQRRRLETFVRALSLTAPSHDKRRSIIQRVIVPGLRSAGRPLMRITPAGVVASTRERLQAAGEPLGLGAVEFLGVRAGLAMLGAIAGVATTTALTGNAGAAPLGALAGIFLGFAIPGFVIDRIGAGRRAAIRRALPTALDMLALSTEAGLSFDGAIGQVARRWDTPLSEELRRVLVEFQMGRDRRLALRELGERTGVPELIRFASAVTQADSLGVPLSRVLHEQSSEIRQRRSQRAEEGARTAPVKMLFPMVVFIFPALFVVILGPAIPRLLEAFTAFQ